MNPKVKTALFAVTFIPYALVPLNGLYGAIFGTETIFGTYRGLKGFLLNALGSLCEMIAIPVIPVCIEFHLLCLLRKKVPLIAMINIKAFAVICAVICSLTAAKILIYFFKK